MEVQTPTYITSSYQRRAYKSYLSRKKDINHENYDPYFKDKIVIHQKIYYQRKKQRKLLDKINSTEDEEIKSKLNEKLKSTYQRLEELDIEKKQFFQSISSSSTNE